MAELDFHEQELAYWRIRTEEAEGRIQQAAAFNPDTRSPHGEHGEQEVEYWRGRAEAAEDRIRHAASFYPAVPPEPPIGTEYRNGDTELVAWRRTGDGWYCARLDCRDCPADWPEVWDRDLSRGTYKRRLPARNTIEQPNDSDV